MSEELPIIPEEEEEMPNPITKTYTRGDGVLEIETIHERPVMKIETRNIQNVRDHIDNLNAMIALWEYEKLEFQEIIDLYDSLEATE